jgi:epsilon-lactone hydrolase
MPSWQARILSVAVRAVVRRRHWGNERELTRRARLVFGAPPVYRSLATYGVRRERVRTAQVRGEWLVPNAAGPGVVLYIHGGGFVACSVATHRPITAALARFARRRVFSAEYRLAPEHRWPAGAEDVRTAYEWLVGTGVPPAEIALAGDSAGGNLALALAVSLRDEGRRLPACVIAFSPWADLAGRGASVRTNDGRCAMFRPENMADFAAAALGAVAADSPLASPVYADLHGLPPVLLHVGSTELLRDDARRVHERIRAAGGKSRLDIYDDVPHGWQMLVPLVPEATASLRAAADFLSEHCTAVPGT